MSINNRINAIHCGFFGLKSLKTTHFPGEESEINVPLQDTYGSLSKNKAIIILLFNTKGSSTLKFYYCQYFYNPKITLSYNQNF